MEDFIFSPSTPSITTFPFVRELLILGFSPRVPQSPSLAFFITFASFFFNPDRDWHCRSGASNVVE
jgi:hypothetical protein